MSEAFSGTETPFVAGDIKGYRTWKVDGGKLHAVVNEHEWTPGENVAQCLRGVGWSPIGGGKPYTVTIESKDITNITVERNDYGSTQHTITCYGMTITEHDPPPHSPADCSCGFYAYFDPKHDEYSNSVSGTFTGGPKISGIVSGYGKVQVGTKGFRAEKAKVLALYMPQYPTAEAAWTEIGRAKGGIVWTRPVMGESINYEALQANYPDVEFYNSREVMLDRYLGGKP
jgi:hypothetical protein